MEIAGGKKFGDRLNVIGSVQAIRVNEIQRQVVKSAATGIQRWGHVTNPAWVSFAATPNIPQRLDAALGFLQRAQPCGVLWARTGGTSLSPLIPFALNGMTFH
jgi:hypothetical protein